MKDEVDEFLDKLMPLPADPEVKQQARAALLALIDKAQVEAVRAELAEVKQLCTIHFDKTGFELAILFGDRRANLKEDGETK